MVGECLESLGLLFSNTGGLRLETSLLAEGDFARFADSMNQCLMEARWLIKGFLDERRPERLWERLVGGTSGSGFDAFTNCLVLPLDLRLSLGGGGGPGGVELVARTGSFSMGGGGVADRGESSVAPSGSLGNSGKMS